MPKIEFRILEIRNLVGTVFHNCNIFGSVDSKSKGNSQEKRISLLKGMQ